MKYIPYHKVKKGNSTGMTAGVKTGQMKVMFQEGKNPYSVGQVVLVNFKQKETVALVSKVNEQSITVEIKGVDRKKVIRYNNVKSIIG